MMPRYVRFARSLALLGGIGAAACPGPMTNERDASRFAGPDAFAPPDSPTPDDDASVVPPDAFVVADAARPHDAPTAPDAFDMCERCTCSGRGGGGAPDAGLPDCFTVPGSEICCAAIGPLPPPDLAVCV